MYSNLDFGDKYDTKNVAFLADYEEEEPLENRFHTRRKVYQINGFSFFRNLRLEIPKDFKFQEGKNEVPLKIKTSYFTKTPNKFLNLIIRITNGKTISQTVHHITEKDNNKELDYEVILQETHQDCTIDFIVNDPKFT